MKCPYVIGYDREKRCDCQPVGCRAEMLECGYCDYCGWNPKVTEERLKNAPRKTVSVAVYETKIDPQTRKEVRDTEHYIVYGGCTAIIAKTRP